MGGTWKSLLGINSFKTSKLRSLLNLTLKRLVVLKNQRQARRTHAQSDVAQLLSLGHRDSAIDRAENVIKEQNMFDLFAMVETHCKFLIERLSLLEHTKVCPEDLKESISTLIYTASTNGEFPELLEVKSMFAARYGHGFVSAAVGGRDNSGVSAKIIELMSTKKLTPATKLKVVRDVAEEQGIAFDLQGDDCSSSSDTISMMTEVDLVIKEGTSCQPHLQSDSPNPSSYYWNQNLPEPTKIKGQFPDAASAAEAAFKSAAFAAAAARVAADLSRSQSQGKGSGGQSSSSSPNVTNDLMGVNKNNASESETNLVRKNCTAQKGKKMMVSGTDDDKQKEEDELVLTNRRYVEYEQKKGGGPSAVEEDECFSVQSPASSKDDDGTSRFKRSFAGKTSFSVRTRRSRSDFGE